MGIQHLHDQFTGAFFHRSLLGIKLYKILPQSGYCAYFGITDYKNLLGPAIPSCFIVQAGPVLQMPAGRRRSQCC
jgi:hypothetical protein